MEKINLQSINERKIANYLDNNIALLTDLTDLKRIDFNEVLIEGFVLAIILNGNVRLKVDDKQYDLKKGDFFVCKPRNIMENAMMSMDLDMKGIFIAPEFAEEIARQINMDWNYRMMALSHKMLHGSREDIERFSAYFVLLQRKLEMPESPNKLKSVYALMASIAYDMFDLQANDEQTLQRQSYSPAENLLQRFLTILEDDNEQMLNVNGYAKRLNVTPKYFSSVCKSLTGMTASQIINDKIIRTAQVMLRDNSYSIKQIADILGFANQSHFGTYFRKHMGISPQLFRKKGS